MTTPQEGTRMMLLGKAPLTVIRLTDGTRKNITAGAAVPESIERDDAIRLVREGYLEIVELVPVAGVDVVEYDEAGEPVVPFDDGRPSGAVDDFPTWSDQARPADWDDFDDDEKRAYVYGSPAEAAEATAPAYADAVLDLVLEKSESDILDTVGDDAVLAAALLARETDGKARKGVSGGLQEVVDAATPEAEQ